MEENMDNQAKWQELERASIPYLKHCRATYTPKSVKSSVKAVAFLLRRRPDLPFQPEDLFTGRDAHWSPRVQKEIRQGIVHFGRWAEHRCSIVVLQS